MSALASPWAAARPDAPALRFGDERWSWSRLDVEARALAASLQALGVREGSRVGVLSENAPEVVLLVHAADRLGAALVLLNARLTPADWRDQLARTRCELSLVGPAHREVELGVRSFVIGELPASTRPLAEVAPDPRRPLVLLFTSGTTGRPKAAVLSRGALVAHAVASARHLGATGDDVHLCNLPLFHVGGLSMIFRVAECGGTLLLHPRFDAARVVEDLARGQVTHLSLVATTLQRLLDALGDRPLEAPALRVVLLGGGPLPDPLRLRAEAARLPLLATYGLTEACSQVTTVAPGERASAGASSGTPLPGVRVRVVDEARREVAHGQAGELEVQSVGLMSGYDGDADATASTIVDGWLRTRDLGTLDARGSLTVHARRTDLILSGGENVYPAEIEAALLGIPGVRDAGVIGRDDARWGQVPVAAVVLDPGVAPDAIRAALEPRLARYKLPREILAVPELPRSASGKLIRERLRALLA